MVLWKPIQFAGQTTHARRPLAIYALMKNHTVLQPSKTVPSSSRLANRTRRSLYPQLIPLLCLRILPLPPEKEPYHPK
jgi:hypothetical protein